MRPARRAGDAALLIDAPGQAAALAAAIGAAGLTAVLDVVPGASTVLVITEPGSRDLAELGRAIDALPVTEPSGAGQPLTEIPVGYDGADLAEVARLTGLSVAEVIARHTAAEYTVGWLGFSPGFGYLTGLDPVLGAVPRLGSPRLSVPAGSVAIAGGLTAVYPAASPGGWRLLGRTTFRLWDADRRPPSVLAPGMRVRFRAVPPDQLPPAAASTVPVSTGRASTVPVSTGRASTAPVSTVQLIMVRPGPLATVQDLGRPGFAAQGVPPSGAADGPSFRLANRLVGNPCDAACIELTLGRAVLRCAGGARLAVTGAAASIHVGGHGRPDRAIGFGTPFDLADGDLVSIGAPPSGLRSYVAVRGGIQVPAVLGSRSSDLLSGIGGGPLRSGAILPVGAEPDPGRVRYEPGLPPAAPLTSPAETVRLRVLPGPRLDWFRAGALARLCRAGYTVTPASNRTGLRLRGLAVPRAGQAELPSEGMVTGALQVPPDGQPILLLADHPVTGGYPVIAVVVSADHGRAAQLRPGQRLRFETVTASGQTGAG